MTDMDRSTVAELLRKHAAPIHPGTGTGQEVHGGGDSEWNLFYGHRADYVVVVGGLGHLVKPDNEMLRGSSYETSLYSTHQTVCGKHLTRHEDKVGYTSPHILNSQPAKKTKGFGKYQPDDPHFGSQLRESAPRGMCAKCAKGARSGSVAKHAAPIHPGTGTGQEVHGGGGKGKSLPFTDPKAGGARNRIGLYANYSPPAYPRSKSVTKPTKNMVPDSCSRCGGAGGYDGWPGFTCFRCGGSGQDPKGSVWLFPADWTDTQIDEFHAKKIAEAEARARASSERAAKKTQAQIEANLTAYPEIRPIYEAISTEQKAFHEIDLRYYGRGDNPDAPLDEYKELDKKTWYQRRDDIEAARLVDPFAAEILAKTHQFDLTDKQVESVLRAQKEFEEKKAARMSSKAEKEKATKPFPTGAKQKVEGTVISHKWQEASNPAWGSTHKMLVEIEGNNRVWLTVPSKIGDLGVDIKGMKVRLVADLEQSRDDEHFGFGSRPSVKKDDIEWFLAENNLEEDPDYPDRGVYRQVEKRADIADLIRSSLAKHGSGDQSPHGNWARNMSGRQLADEAQAPGFEGFSVHHPSGARPTTGYAFSPYPQAERPLPLDQITPATINAYRREFADLLAQPDTYLGAWLDPATNQVFLDVSVVLQDLDEARSRATAANQYAIWDLSADQQIDLDTQRIAARRVPLVLQ